MNKKETILLLSCIFYDNTLELKHDGELQTKDDYKVLREKSYKKATKIYEDMEIYSKSLK